MCIRRDVFCSLGGFDENYFLRSEEVDLCWRVWKSGRKVVLAPGSIVWHKKSASMPNESPNSFYYSFKNRAYLLFTNYEFSNLARSLPHLYLTDLYFILKMIRKGKSEHLRAILRGHKWFLLNLKSAARSRASKSALRKVDDKDLFGKAIHETDFLTFLMSSAPRRFGIITTRSGDLKRKVDRLG